MSGRGSPRWGWHRLAGHHATALVELAGVGRRDLALDLGAGDGVITQRLAETGARVIAFELHPTRVETLRARFVDEPRVKVVRADVTDLRLPTRSFHVVANPPFDGLSSILARLTSRHSRLERATLVVPRAVARRWSQRLAPDRRWRIEVAQTLPRSAFTPRPRIDCVVIRLGRTR